MTSRLPIATGLCAALVLLGGGVSAADQRSDARAATEQLAAERAGEQAYVEAVRLQMQTVYDTLQPIYDVLDAFQTEGFPLEAGLGVRDDVLAEAGIGEALREIRDEVRALPVPAGGQTRADELVESLTGLVSAADQMAELTRSRADEDGYIVAFDDAESALGQARDAYLGRLKTVVQEGLLVPRDQRAGFADMPDPVSVGDYLRRVGTVCAAAQETYEREFGEEADSEDLATGLLVVERSSALEVETARAMLAVTRPAVVGDGRIPSALANHIAAFGALEDAVRADGRSTQTRLDALLALEGATDAAVSAAGRAFEKVGSLTCADWLDPFGDLADEPPDEPQPPSEDEPVPT